MTLKSNLQTAALLAVILILLGGVVAAGLGICYLRTGGGAHYGYVTAVETTGIFIKTTTVYFKSDTQSTQEDAYCARDSNIIDKLNDFGDQHQRVKISFSTHIAWAKGCTFGADPLITAVEVA